MLDRALEEAGIARGELFVTNAVKHFKHEPRGKRRLHQRPNRGEVEICRWWVKHELELVKPKLIVALGVTALQSPSTHKGSLSAVRDQTLTTREGRPMRATIHPSMLLRLPIEANKEAEFARFVADLKAANTIAATMPPDLPFLRARHSLARGGHEMSTAELAEHYVRNIGARNIDDLLSLFAEDAVFTTPDGREFAGVIAIREMYALLFSHNLPPPRIATSFATARGVANEIVADLPDGKKRHTANFFHVNDAGKIQRLTCYRRD